MNFSQRFRVYGVRDGVATIFQEYFGFDFPTGHSVMYSDLPIDVTGVDDFQIRVCIVNSGNTQRIWCYDDVSLEVLAGLPVEMKHFEVSKKQDQVLLEWATSSETNNAGFEIERSTDGRSWDIIDFVEGKGTTAIAQQYSYIDARPVSGDNYYRLKQMDFDQQCEYSEVKHVIFNEQVNNLIRIYPNPAYSVFSVGVFNPDQLKARVKLFSSSGKLLWHRNFAAGEMKTYWRKDFDLPQEEVYFVQAQVGKQAQTEKVVVIDRR